MSSICLQIYCKASPSPWRNFTQEEKNNCGHDLQCVRFEKVDREIFKVAFSTS